MGRFYAITVGSTSWTSQFNGVDNPGALDVEFDIFENTFGIPNADAGASTITIHGVALADLQQASQFSGQPINVIAGMSAGLPLANPQQRGPILVGQVLQSFGNWQGTEMTVDFVVQPATFTMANPGEFVFNWQKGTTLQNALSQAISGAYASVTTPPTTGFRITGTYAPIATGALARYSTLANLAKAVQSMTKSASPDGMGVRIAFVNGTNTILAYDVGQTATSPLQLVFTDLVGQPTYVDVNTVQLTTVLRGDIAVGTFITMPPGLPYAPGTVATAGSAFGSGFSGSQQLKYRSSFQGTFVVTAMRHIGNFRDPNGASWVSVITCVPNATPATNSGS